LPSGQKQKPDELPLEYMLRIMRDPTVEDARRDKMAALAAPFCHPRIADNRFGVKSILHTSDFDSVASTKAKSSAIEALAKSGLRPSM
jgi:hypothetical protein